MIIGMILARKGSERLPGKNMLDFNGKPLIQYTIEAAVDSICDEVIVSTDDIEVMKLCKNFEVIVRDRPRALCGGDILPDPIVLYEMIGRELDDIIVLLQPTSPLRTARDIDKAIESFKSYNCLKQLISVNKNTLKPNGAIYISTYLQLLKALRFYSKDMILYTMQVEKSIDIDYLYQFRIGEAIMRGDIIKISRKDVI